jgi:hypothetical protein
VVGSPIIITCAGFAADGAVNITFTPAGGSSSILIATTADDSGTVASYTVTLPVDAIPGDYTLGCSGKTPEGATSSIVSDPFPVAGPATPPDPTPLPTPIGPSDGISTTSVSINACSAVSLRSGPSMNSTAVTLVQAGIGPFDVYDTPLIGGDWGASLESPYSTCDGQGDHWYELSDGPNAGDYFFAGGVRPSAPVLVSLSCSTANAYICVSAPASVVSGQVATINTWSISDTNNNGGDCWLVDSTDYYWGNRWAKLGHLDGNPAAMITDVTNTNPWAVYMSPNVYLDCHADNPSVTGSTTFSLHY